MPEAPLHAPQTEAATETVVSVKGFGLDWKCRDFQFEVGKTYEHAGKIKACYSGFHAIEGYPLEVFGYYAPGKSRYAEVKQSGALARHSNDSKVASAKITIEAELKIPDLVKRAVDWVISKTTPAESKHAEGYQSASSAAGYQSASSATGYQSASSATGYQSASSATGDQSASSATGDRSASSATGDQSASSATGDQSASSATGDQSASSATGYQSASSATGYRSASSATGDQSASSATGYQSASSATGYRSAAMNCGYEGRVMAADGCAMFLVFRDDDYNIIHAWAGIAGKNSVKPLVWYTLDSDGQPVEVV